MSEPMVELRFTEVLAKATHVFGSQRAAEEWLNQPQASLDHRRPLELLASPQGADVVETHLMRLEHVVYT